VFTRLLLKNFKGWEDTGPIRLAPITVFFGSNSSGKTSLLQSILLLKQTQDSPDRSRVLHPGHYMDARSLVDLGTVADIVFRHDTERVLEILLAWTLDDVIPIPKTPPPRELQFMLGVGLTPGGEPFVEHARYHLGQAHAAMLRRADGSGYDVNTVPTLGRRPGRPTTLPRPTRFYGFPEEVGSQFRNVQWLADLAFALEKQLRRVHYVGPLREYPRPSYVWVGERPDNVGTRGEAAVAALLAAGAQSREVGRGQGTGRRYTPFDQVVAGWLKRMGLIQDFVVRRIAEQRKEYEVRIRRSPESTEVPITHVGFGVSQVLPVLVQSYYAERQSTIIFEQPEIHLHPRVQADLAEVLVDAAKVCDVQFIVESHSEHFLRRLQRLVAEEKGITRDDVALYVCNVEDGRSTITALEVNEVGSITNWPKDFFGDDLEDLVAMSEAALRRARH
jgi:predicted ATPase